VIDEACHHLGQRVVVGCAEEAQQVKVFRSGVCSALLGALVSLFWASAGFAQDMMRHVDLSSPAFTQAELSRADIEQKLAGLKQGETLDLAAKALNGLDLSGLDLRRVNLQSARLNKANLKGANLDGVVFD